MALATLRVEECEDIEKQLAFELNLPYSESIVEALAIWIQDARGEAKMLSRTYGLLADDITWHQLAPVARQLPVHVEEPGPPAGDKAKKLINDGQEFAARELKLQEIWTKKLVEELQASEAPVLKKLQLSLDPERASEFLAGSARPNTLRLWRIYLQETKVRLPPGKPADLVDYLLARKDKPCGRSVPPEAIMKAIRWFEIIAEFVEEDCASHGHLAWAAKDKIVEALSEGAPLTKRAPRYPTILLVKIERYILDDSEPSALRVFGWVKLLKTWASLRWSDLRAIKPAELRLTDGRLATTLRKTKTSGPTKRVKGATKRKLRLTAKSGTGPSPSRRLSTWL